MTEQTKENFSDEPYVIHDMKQGSISYVEPDFTEMGEDKYLKVLRLKQQFQSDSEIKMPAHIDMGHPLWYEAVSNLTKRGTGYTAMIRDADRNNAYSKFFSQHARGKTVCDLGVGTGCLLALADFHGAKKCIGIDKNFWSNVYLKGRFPKWNIIHDCFNRAEWPEADIYIHEMVAYNFYGEGIVPLFESAKERGVIDKLYPNTVNLYELEQTKMYGEDTKVDYGGDLDKAGLTYLDMISDLQHAWEQVGFRNQKLWCDYTDTFKITKQIYEGDILGGEKFHDPDKKVMLGWECGFDGKHNFTNMGLTHWRMTYDWDFTTRMYG